MSGIALAPQEPAEDSVPPVPAQALEQLAPWQAIFCWDLERVPAAQKGVKIGAGCLLVCGATHGSHGPRVACPASSGCPLPPIPSGPNGAAPSLASSVSVLPGRAGAGSIFPPQ